MNKITTFLTSPIGAAVIGACIAALVMLGFALDWFPV
jgi:hypothetical protein